MFSVCVTGPIACRARSAEVLRVTRQPSITYAVPSCGCRSAAEPYLSVLQPTTDGTLEAMAMQQLPPLLAGAAQHPPCPDFLFTAQPAFPWAPTLCTHHQANTALQRQHEAFRATSAKGTPTTKRRADVEAGSEAKRQRADAQAALHAACEVVQAALVQAEALPAALSPACVAALDVVLAHAAAPSSAASQAIAASGLDAMSDDAVLLVVSEEVSAAASYARCCTVATIVVFPALRRLHAAPSRSLTAAVDHLGAANPSALVEHCFRPLLQGGAGLSQGQAGLVVRCVKGVLPMQLLGGLIEAASEVASSVGGRQGASDGVGTGPPWQDPTLAAVQAVVDAKPALGPETLAALVVGLRRAAASDALSASVKLGKLLLATAKNLGPQMNAQLRGQLREAASGTSSFMTKPTLAALDKLR